MVSAASHPPPPAPAPDGRRVALLTLGCARNEVDSEELAARLHADGWEVTGQGGDADVVLVNTCGFVEKAKQDSIETLLAAAGTGAKVVAAGCMAERYGRELADSLPEAQAVLGFDDYPEISARLGAVLAGESITAHVPRDRRELLPLTPVARRDSTVVLPGHGTGRPAGAAGPAGSASPVVDERTPAHLRQVLRHRLDSGPVASLKLASGCDRRCAFCAIPAFRGAFVSRPPEELLAEAEWLAKTGVRELVLVSENSTSYGKDLGDPRLLEKLLPQLAAVTGIVRVRVSYLQPAETRPGLIEAIAGTPGVAPYFDLSFQHSSEPVLRRMRRFGSSARFLDLLASARALAPAAGARSNFIVGFPGETRADVAELVRFLSAARLDAIGVFDYSDEDGTEAAGLPGKVPAATVKRRYDRLAALADELCSQRAEERVGSTVEVLVDTVDDGLVEGRAAHQAPEVDGSTTLVAAGGVDLAGLRPGDLVRATVTGTEGVDLLAVPDEMISAAA
ncbi:30S ribosomal protein S12 methylthiotransferase RimO [Solwaraspora sp. WMMD1047]|uniref:30S ribosomal protein S12 methylthiotransferase RimO n=1 Tax=Solwaraspora sp. WMMD1047 TaxID=3016102 RepID=UPI00241747EF|nr:30S ribosomal protein S12 methylthiotransferase RimO [Solwaraspora sp. WMMD1047]MDG4829695.1 30S ribosomal protein S12 methylthiotransferase RimO [Solwaraspora sp. WMMD1047]